MNAFMEQTPCPSWMSEAREALAHHSLGLDDDGRIVFRNGKRTEFRLDPVADGLTVYLRDTLGTRFWLGTPGHVYPVLRWLLTLRGPDVAAGNTP